MRQFVEDDKLHKLLNGIEEWLGYNILAEPMPIEHQALARCSIHLSEQNRWYLWYINDTPLTQATLCHELMHLALWIEGYPGFRTPVSWESGEYRTQIIALMCNFVLHIEVWKMVRDLGFNETMDYRPGVDELVSQVGQCRLFQNAYNPAIILPGRAAYIAHGLLCPAEPEIRKQLRDVARNTMPKALELADAICRVFEKRYPISPQSCVSALYDILDIIGAPREILQVSFPDNTYPDFRSRILF